MFFRRARLLVALMLTLTLGMHWALLQTIAWTSMLAGNLHSSSFREAVSKTFDGKHPCCLCKMVEKEKSSEQKKPFTVSVFKPEFTPCHENFVFSAPSEFRFHPRVSFFASALPQTPPTPPPRGFFV